MADYYNRYKPFGDMVDRHVVPFVEISEADTDLRITFLKSRMRLDTLSYKYYGDADYGWLLMLANPRYGYYEYLIPDGADFRIPYPLSTAIKRYESAVSDAVSGKSL